MFACVRQLGKRVWQIIDKGITVSQEKDACTGSVVWIATIVR
jgi:hypothetical protein